MTGEGSNGGGAICLAGRVCGAPWGMARSPRSPSGGRPPGWAVFLRGVNVGGKHKLPMAELRAFIGELGAREVRTYLQSGNAVFLAGEAQAVRIEAGFDERSEARFGFPVPALLRSAPELRRVLADNPFLAAGADEKALHVLLLRHPPAPDAVAALDPARSPPDAFAVRGRSVYLYLPGGVARTRLSNAYVDRTLGTTSTGRNWRTLRAVAALLDGAEAGRERPA